jgi:hypothetical protein
MKSKFEDLQSQFFLKLFSTHHCSWNYGYAVAEQHFYEKLWITDKKYLLICRHAVAEQHFFKKLPLCNDESPSCCRIAITDIKFKLRLPTSMFPLPTRGLVVEVSLSCRS